jgi:MFS family permease
MDYGIGVNRGQILQLLLQVLLVGMTLGMTRTVVPALAESEFGVPRGSFMLLAAFVVAFGFVKGAMNFVAGRLAERIGRQRVLLVGWLVAVPIPVLVYLAPSWNWIVLATVLLGVNQGLTWSMTQTAKLDLTRADQRGLVIGLNEFAGYVGVAVAGVVTGMRPLCWARERACCGSARWSSAWPPCWRGWPSRRRCLGRTPRSNAKLSPRRRRHCDRATRWA